jgi:type I restriction enzyme S subunit
MLTKIPEDWEVVKLGNVIEYIKGKKPEEVVEEFKEGYLPYLSTGNLRNNEKPNFARPSNTTILVSEGDLILLWDGSNAGEFFVGKTGILSSTMVKIQLKREDINKIFLFYLLKTKEVFLTGQTQGTGIPHVDKNVFENLQISLPPLSEQKAIANILTTVDSAIQKVDEIIAKTERLKKGLMQQLLTKGIGHKEFKDTEIGRIPKEWEVVRLGDVAEFKNGINFTKEQKGNQGILTIDVLNMYGEQVYVNLTNLYRVNIPSINDDYLLRKGDILFVRSSLKREGVGWVSLFNGWNEPVTFAGFIIRARLNRVEILPEFLTYFLRSNIARKALVSSSGQVAITNITQDFLKIFKVPFPSTEEQQRIVEMLFLVDKKLELERKRKEKLERIKKGLMNDLLTGRKRVKVK